MWIYISVGWFEAKNLKSHQNRWIEIRESSLISLLQYAAVGLRSDAGQARRFVSN